MAALSTFKNPFVNPLTFIPHSERYIAVTADVDLMGLERVPDEFMFNLHVHLEDRLSEVCDKVISDAMMQLQPGHGYETGRMHDTLVSRLVEEVEGMWSEGVFYDLLSDEAPYWVYVEFGHMTRAGNWWVGYHFLENAVLANTAFLDVKVAEAVFDTFADMGMAASVEGVAMGALDGGADTSLDVSGGPMRFGA